MTSTSTHEFGGQWTQEKLERVRKYLTAYTTIFRRNERARYLKTIYVDAFAGTGHRIDSGDANAGDVERDAFLKGSARIALEVEPAFDSYLFIEQDKDRVRDLELLRLEFAELQRQVTVVKSEANSYLRSWCKQVDWRKHRAVVFLDPYGMQVEWSLIEAIATTKGIDLWLLFPLGIGVNRMLTRGELPPEDWGNRLTRFFGTEEWMNTFYTKREDLTLFGEVQRNIKDTDFNKISEYFVGRLRSIFAQVAPKPLPLRNSMNNPLYLLCFATHNQTALKIASDILRK